MYGKVIILFALTGCLSVVSQSNTTEASTTVSTQPTTNTTQAASTTTEASSTTTEASSTTTQASSTTTQAPTTSSQASNATTQASSTTTQAPTTSSQASNATTQASSTTTQAPTTSSQASNATTQATTSTTNATEVNNSTLSPAVTSRPHRFPKPPPLPGFPHNHRFPGPPPRPGFHHDPRGPPPPPRPNGIPNIPIISDILNAINNAARSIAPRPDNRGRPGPGRPPRSINFQVLLNASSTPGFFGGQSLPGFPGVPDISDLQIPNVEDMVPEMPEIPDPSSLEIPEIENLPSIPRIPGLQIAIDAAREIVAEKINAGQDLVAGIQNAIEIGLSSPDPTAAMRALLSAILNGYLFVARNCPLMIVGGYVMREGLYLASDILRTIADVSAQLDG